MLKLCINVCLVSKVASTRVKHFLAQDTYTRKRRKFHCQKGDCFRYIRLWACLMTVNLVSDACSLQYTDEGRYSDELNREKIGSYMNVLN